MISLCIDCKNIISDYRSIRCWKCYSKLHKGKNHPCFGKSYNKGENHPNWKGGKPHCDDCGKQLALYSATQCQSCSHKGEKNPNYIHGQSRFPYNGNFNKQAKENIRIRDNYKCQICSKSEKSLKRKLSIHHIDYNKDNCNKDNLISLCLKCHCKTNYNRDYWFAYCMYIIENMKGFK
jgi:hypothetical protein